jgi:ABC-type sugar transport system ATPase subunit
VSFEGVTKRFGEVLALEALDLDIEDREFMVLLGPSGCGKSTALRMIAGLESITEGTLRIGDRVVNDVPATDRDIAMVFQSYALYPHMTVRKNIESPLVARRATRVREPERSRRVEEAASLLSLSEYLDRKPAELSGGQRQRVALARAIVRRPDVFLMDEPLSNLDAKLRTQTRMELVSLWRRLETTFVYVTHDQVEAMTMATRIAILKDGRLQQVGRPQEVYDRPANLFVAGFIGSPPMNTIEGEIRDGWLVTAAGALQLPSNGLVPSQGTLVMGVRPEQLSIGPGPLRATVLNVELLGPERHVVLEVGGQHWTIREPTGTPAPTPGQAVELTVQAGSAHLFDPTTTLRLP